MSMTKLEIKAETVTHEVAQESPLPVLRQKFQSRNADFLINTSKYRYLKNSAISLRLGPLGMDLNPDESEALGEALIAAARHYRAVSSREMQP